MLKSMHLLDWSHLRDRDVGLSHPPSTAPTDARKKKVVNDAVADIRELKVQPVFRQLILKDAVVETIDPDWRSHLLAVITNPNITYLPASTGCSSNWSIRVITAGGGRRARLRWRARVRHRLRHFVRRRRGGVCRITPLIGGFALLSATFFVGVLGTALKVDRRKPVSGAEGMIGSVAEALEDFTGVGTVRPHGETRRAPRRWL